MNLDDYTARQLDRGASRIFEALWIFSECLFVKSPIPGSWHRVALLRIFGASIGKGCVVKPEVHVKFPWKLRLGDNVWLGERCWIDNLDQVDIGDNSCISQGAYLCTGSHDWRNERFPLLTYPIFIGSSVWVSAFTKIGPGVSIGDCSVVTLGSVVTKSVEKNCIMAGNPAILVKHRYER